MNISEKKGYILLPLSSIVFMGSSYMLNIFLGRYLGPKEYGLYGVIISLMTAVNLTQTTGLPQAVSKFVSENDKKADVILRKSLILQGISTIAATIVFISLSYPIAKLLKDITLAPYIQLSALIFPIYGIYAIYSGYYNGLHKFKTQAQMNMSYSILKLITIIVLIFIFKVYGAIYGFIISPFLALLFWGHFPKKTLENFQYKKLILFSLPLICFAILSNLLQSIDLLFVKALLHSNQLAGFYTANQNIAEIPFLATTAIATILFPNISKSVSNNLHDRTKNLIKKSMRLCLMLIVPGVLLISATSKELLAFFYSSSYLPGADSLSILVIGSGFFTFFILLTTIISSAGSPMQSAILSMIGLILSSVFCLILIPLFGLNGAALSTTFAAIFVVCVAGIIVYTKFKVLLSMKSAVKVFCSSLIIYVIAYFIPIPILLLPFFYVFLLGLFVLLLLILKELENEDIQLIKSLLPIKNSKNANL